MNHKDPLNFPRQLIKGKIAETVFDQMFREKDGFIVIPFGYETILPEICQFADISPAAKKVKDTVRNTPDFALISHERGSIYLVEVKYRENPTSAEIIEIAEKVHDRWKLAWVFLATNDGLYFDSCSNIKHNKSIKTLDASWVPMEKQKKYFSLLREFLHN